MSETTPRAFAPKMSIRTRIVLMVTGSLVVAMAINGYMVRQVVSRSIIQQKLVTVEVLTTSIVHDLTYDAGRGESESGPQVVEKYMTYYRIISDMTLYDEHLRATAAADPKRIGTNAEDEQVRAALLEAKPTLEVTRPSLRNFGVRSIAPILQGSRIVGAVVVDLSMQDLEQTLATMDRQLMVTSATILALMAAALFLVLRGSVMVRLQRLMSATEEIRAGNYEVRVVDLASDEIGDLGKALNQMSTELQASRKQIEEYNKHLEERVQEATAELARAYGDLQSAQSQLVLNEKMASLGVLIAGVAHEINTPVGAILNVSRNLLKGLKSLPQDLIAYREDGDVPVAQVVDCLEDLLAASCRPQAPASYQTQRAVEGLLRELGIANPMRCAAALCKLNMTDEEIIRRHSAFLRNEACFALAESFTSIAQAVTIAEGSSQKIAEIVKALKYYAYSDKDRVDLIAINESITTALVLLRNQLKHSVHVVTDLAPGLPPLACSSDIHQAWTNLLTNAYDAVSAREGLARPEIRIATHERDDAIVVTVSDNGIGIPKEGLTRIFDPFYTTKDIGKGTGLGLSIVSGIVKKHGGTLHVESEPGRTTFEIVLPIRGAQAMADGAEGTPDAFPASAATREAA